MKNKITLNKIKNYGFLLIAFFSLTILQAQTRFWVGGNGSTNSTLNWAATSSGASGASLPTAAIVFDDFSGFNTSNTSYTITQNNNSFVVTNVTFSITAATTATNVTINIVTPLGQLFKITGDMHINVPPTWTVNFINAHVSFFPLAPNFQTHTINFYNSKVLFSGTALPIVNFEMNSVISTYNVSGKFAVDGTTPSSIASEVYFGDNTAGSSTVNFLTHAAELKTVKTFNNTTVNFNKGFTKATVLPFVFNVGVNSTVNVQDNSDFSALSVTGVFTATNVALVGSVISGGGSAASLDITSSTVTVQNTEENSSSTDGGLFTYGNSGGSFGTLLTTGSKIIFPDGVGLLSTNTPGFIPYSYTFNEVYISDRLNEKFTKQSIIYSNNYNATFNKLIIDADIKEASAQGSNFTINNLFKIFPGHTYISSLGSSTATSSTITALGTASVNINGYCDSVINIKGLNFKFNVGSNLNADYLVLNNSTVATSTANAGLNSVFYPGSTNTNWVISGTPVARILKFHINPLNINSTTAPIYGKWYDKNNWDEVDNFGVVITPSVCPPTNIDKVIFPTNSYVFCDRNIQQTKDMVWEGNGAIEGNTSQELEIWGSLDFGTYGTTMQNNFLGTVWFKGNQPNQTITTGGRAFGSGVIFDAVPTAALGTYSTSAGEWTLLDSLYAPNYDLVDNNYPYIHTNGFFAGSTNIYNNILLKNGHLKTGIDAVAGGPCVEISSASNSQNINCQGMIVDQGQLSLFNSDLTIKGTSVTFYGNGSFWVRGNTTRVKINSGTSTIKLVSNVVNASSYGSYPPQTQSPNLAPIAQLGNGFKYYDIVFTGANTTGILCMFQDTVHNIKFKGGGIIRNFSGNGIGSGGVAYVAQTPTVSKPAGIIERADFLNSNLIAHIDAYYQNVSGPANSATAADTSYTNQITIDSLYFSGNGDFDNINTTIRSVLSFTPGYNYNIKNGQYVGLAASSTGTNYPYYNTYTTCLSSSPWNYPTGGQLNAVGTCTSIVAINNGSIIVNAPTAGVVDYCQINNTTMTGVSSYSCTNSVLNTAPGWIPIGAPIAPRKLRWKNADVTSTSREWNVSSSWEHINNDGTPVLMSPNNCPPTRIDTVVFDALSFAANSSTVHIGLSGAVAECYSMYWGTQNMTSYTYSNSASASPVFDAASSQQLHIFGNLSFNTGMVQNFRGPITFRGPTDVNYNIGNGNTITSAGQSFKEYIVFNADSANKRWYLKDAIYSVATGSLAANNAIGGVNLWKGKLYTESNPVNIGNFYSVSSSSRLLDLGSSSVLLNSKGGVSAGGNAWAIADGVIPTMTLSAGQSTITLNVKDPNFSGGGKSYYNLKDNPLLS